MDFATFLGIVSAIALVVGAISYQGNLSFFFNLSAFLIVIGGTLAATLVNYPLKDVFRVLKVVKNAFFSKTDELIDVIPKFVRYGRIARRDGILALERMIHDEEDTFIAEGLRMIVDGVDPITIREIMETEIEYLAERHRVGYEIFESMGSYAPAFGMIGTLIGLILMLRYLDSPEKIGPSMSVALVTTFYGALLANILFLPIAGKLKERSRFEILKKQMILTGILSLQQGDIPKIIEQKLVSFLSTSLRERYLREGNV